MKNMIIHKRPIIRFKMKLTQAPPLMNLIDSINVSNLPVHEQAKLINIANLQKEIENTQKFENIPLSKEPLGETNLRREKQLTERERVELEMKKWQKKVFSYLKID